jgi:hypothetical protein
MHLKQKAFMESPHRWTNRIGHGNPLDNISPLVDLIASCQTKEPAVTIEEALSACQSLRDLFGTIEKDLADARKLICEFAELAGFVHDHRFPMAAAMRCEKAVEWLKYHPLRQDETKSP